MKRMTAGVVWPVVAALLGFVLAFGWSRAGTDTHDSLQRDRGRGAIDGVSSGPVADQSAPNQPPAIADDVSRAEPANGRDFTSAANAAVPVAVPLGDEHGVTDDLLVFGRVTLANEPVAQALVAIDDGRGTVARAATDASGRYAFAAFAPGGWTVQVSAQGATTTTFEHDARAVRVEVELDVVLEPCRVLLVHTVDAKGAPLALAASLANGYPLELFVTAEPLPERIAPRDDRYGNGADFTNLARVDANFESERATEQSLVARAFVDDARASHVSLFHQERLVAHTPLEPTMTAVVLKLDEHAFAREDATLRFRTVDANSGEPSACEVDVEQRGGGSNDPTDDDGRWVDEELSPGWTQVEVRAPGRALVQRSVYLESGADLDLGDIPIPSAVVLRGRAFDEQGRGAIVSLAIGTVDPGSGTVQWRRGRRARSDGEGAFEVTDLAPTTIAVRVEAPSYVSSTRADPQQVSRCVFVEARHLTEAELVVPVESGTLVRLRRTDRLQPVLRIVALDEHGFEVGRCRCGGFVNDDALALPIGTYTLVAHESDREVARRVIETRGEPFDVLFD